MKEWGKWIWDFFAPFFLDEQGNLLNEKRCTSDSKSDESEAISSTSMDADGYGEAFSRVAIVRVRVVCERQWSEKKGIKRGNKKEI